MIFVLDAAALLNNENFSFEEGNSYITTRLVFDEWRDMRSRSLALSAFGRNALEVKNPFPERIAEARGIAESCGFFLSEADISVVALALELKSGKKDFAVLSDDFAVQNALKKTGVRFSGVIQGEIRGFRAKTRGKKKASHQ